MKISNDRYSIPVGQGNARQPVWSGKYDQWNAGDRLGLTSGTFFTGIPQPWSNEWITANVYYGVLRSKMVGYIAGGDLRDQSLKSALSTIGG